MCKEIRLVGNILTTTTKNVLTPISLALAFNADCIVDVENYMPATYEEPAEGGAEIEIEVEGLFIADSENNCFEIFEKLPELECAIDRKTEYHSGDSSGSFGSSFAFVAKYVECFVDLETKQIFYIEKDKQVFDTEIKKWIRIDFIHEITDYVPSDVLEWNLKQASIEA